MPWGVDLPPGGTPGVGGPWGSHDVRAGEGMRQAAGMAG